MVSDKCLQRYESWYIKRKLVDMVSITGLKERIIVVDEQCVTDNDNRLLSSPIHQFLIKRY